MVIEHYTVHCPSRLSLPADHESLKAELEEAIRKRQPVKAGVNEVIGLTWRDLAN